jgi:hypothetical protein
MAARDQLYSTAELRELGFFIGRGDPNPILVFAGSVTGLPDLAGVKSA